MLVATGNLFQRAHCSEAMANESLSFSGDHGMIPPVSLPFVGDNLSFVFFHDFGNVFMDGKEMIKSLGRWYQPHRQDCRTEATSNLCSFAYVSQAVGSGIRYRTPIGPVRVDFGYNLNPSTYPAFEPDANGNPVFAPHTTRRINVFFSIGQTF